MRAFKCRKHGLSWNRGILEAAAQQGNEVDEVPADGSERAERRVSKMLDELIKAGAGVPAGYAPQGKGKE